MPRAIWKDTVIADSDAAVVFDGNHYFPPQALVNKYFTESPTRTVCGWKGEAHYFSIAVEGDVNEDAAWYYPTPKEAAKQITGHVAFWRGVEIRD